VVKTNLILQFRKARNQAVKPLGPDRFQKLEFVVQVLRPDTPTMKCVILSLLDGNFHSFATLAVHGSQTCLEDLSFRAAQPQPMKIPPRLLKTASHLGEGLVKIRWNLDSVLKTGENSLHCVTIGLVRDGQRFQGLASDFCVARKGQKPGGNS
jgi:hypothetical protein